MIISLKIREGRFVHSEVSVEELVVEDELEVVPKLTVIGSANADPVSHPKSVFNSDKFTREQAALGAGKPLALSSW